jgi:hypothetical protein
VAIEVFNRHENKYIISGGVYARLCAALSEHMELDDYNKRYETYPIANLYYDTADSQLIRASLAKPRYKEKLRLRAYGVPGRDSKVYVELKKKVNGLVNKRRTAMTLGEAYAFLESGEPPELRAGMNRQVVGEIAYLLQTRELRPAAYISYDRKAFFGIGEHDVRVSFDTNIRTRRGDLRLESGAYGEPLLDADTRLMEIKVARSIPVWLCRLLSKYQIYPAGFSKYGAEYTRTLANAAERAQTQRTRVFAPRYDSFPAFEPAIGSAAAQ